MQNTTQIKRGFSDAAASRERAERLVAAIRTVRRKMFLIRTIMPLIVERQHEAFFGRYVEPQKPNKPHHLFAGLTAEPWV